MDRSTSQSGRSFQPCAAPFPPAPVPTNQLHLHCSRVAATHATAICHTSGKCDCVGKAGQGRPQCPPYLLACASGSHSHAHHPHHSRTLDTPELHVGAAGAGVGTSQINTHCTTAPCRGSCGWLDMEAAKSQSPAARQTKSRRHQKGDPSPAHDDHVSRKRRVGKAMHQKGRPV